MVASAYHGVRAPEAARQSCGWVQREIVRGAEQKPLPGWLPANEHSRRGICRCIGITSAARINDLSALPRLANLELLLF